jgi:hypothetical protein
MRAVVVATGMPVGAEALASRTAAELTPLIDRPFLQHVVETLVGQGILEIDFLLSHGADRVEHLLSDGRRWGATFRYHLVRDPQRPLGHLRMPTMGEGPVLFGYGDRLPPARFVEDSGGDETVLWGAPVEGEAWRWHGWAWLPAPVRRQVRRDWDEAVLGDFLTALPPGRMRRVDTGLPVGVRSGVESLESQWQVLEGRFTGLMHGGREVEPGVWLARNVSLDPSARIVPPVYIGEDCRVEAGVRVGPRAVVGRVCILDRQCVVERSLIQPGAYLGQGLEVADAIVDMNRVYSVALDAVIDVADAFLVGRVEDAGPRKTAEEWAHRALAGLALAATWPAALTGLVRSRRQGTARLLVRQPADRMPDRWATFPSILQTPGEARVEPGIADLVGRVLPGLWHVARGELRLVGVPARTPEELESLPDGWRDVALAAPAGLVTEADVLYQEAPTEDERFAAEAVYAATRSPSRDAMILLAYAARLLGLTPPPVGALDPAGEAD